MVLIASTRAIAENINAKGPLARTGPSGMM
jgi:hypothetical protein